MHRARKITQREQVLDDSKTRCDWENHIRWSNRQKEKRSHLRRWSSIWALFIQTNKFDHSKQVWLWKFEWAKGKRLGNIQIHLESSKLYKDTWQDVVKLIQECDGLQFAFKILLLVDTARPDEQDYRANWRQPNGQKRSGRSDLNFQWLFRSKRDR